VLIEGFQVMLLGAGAVFVFLGLLVTSLHLLGRIARRFPAADAPPSGAADAELAAAIAAALDAHRRGKG